MAEGSNGDIGRQAVEPDRELVRPSWVKPAKKDRLWVHVMLFLATAYTTTLAGMQQAIAMRMILDPDPLDSQFDIVAAMWSPTYLMMGLPFSFTILLILGIHEMGHYVTSRAWRVRASLPYFIPFPSFIGTMGAVIRLRSRIPNRRALMDIGASGPLAGFVVAVLAIIVGMYLSVIIPAEQLHGEGGSIELGRSFLSSFLFWMVIGDVPDGYLIYDHPIFVAGWIGLFVTALNLLPVGQFDGGHIVYALFGRLHSVISKGTIVMLGVLWALGPPYDWMNSFDMLSSWMNSRWPGWLVWIFLSMFLGRWHPPPDDPEMELDSNRQWIGYVTLAIFLLCFTPMPITITP